MSSTILQLHQGCERTSCHRPSPMSCSLPAFTEPWPLCSLGLLLKNGTNLCGQLSSGWRSHRPRCGQQHTPHQRTGNSTAVTCTRVHSYRLSSSSREVPGRLSNKCQSHYASSSKVHIYAVKKRKMYSLKT